VPAAQAAKEMRQTYAANILYARVPATRYYATTVLYSIVHCTVYSSTVLVVLLSYSLQPWFTTYTVGTELIDMVPNLP